MCRSRARYEGVGIFRAPPAVPKRPQGMRVRRDGTPEEAPQGMKVRVRPRSSGIGRRQAGGPRGGPALRGMGIRVGPLGPQRPQAPERIENKMH